MLLLITVAKGISVNYIVMDTGDIICIVDFNLCKEYECKTETLLWQHLKLYGKLIKISSSM